MRNEPKKILIIAGPNGAGKTTTAFELIKDNPFLYEFLNADEIARGLAPKHPEGMALKAGKLMIQRLRELLDQNRNFAFETTLAGKNYQKYLIEAKSKGYEIILFFLWLSSPEQAIKRVVQRVNQGGHDIPNDVIIRRYHAGIKNLINNYLPLSDLAYVVNNSSKRQEGKITDLIARKGASEVVDILNRDIWEKIGRIANER